MNIVVIVLAISTALTFLAGAVQGIVAWHSADLQLQKKLRPSIIGCIILTIALVCVSYYSQSSNSDTKTLQPSASPSLSSNTTATLETIPTQVNKMPTVTPTAMPTVTPTATPTPQIIVNNHPLTCVSSCTIAITIDTIAIDRGNSQMIMMLTIKSTLSKSLQNVEFRDLSFQDPAGQTYPAQGQADFHNDFNLGPRQSLDLTATYPFEPQPGVIYTLTTLMYYTTNISIEENIYQNEQFSF